MGRNNPQKDPKSRVLTMVTQQFLAIYWDPILQVCFVHRPNFQIYIRQSICQQKAVQEKNRQTAKYFQKCSVTIFVLRSPEFMQRTSNFIDHHHHHHHHHQHVGGTTVVPAVKMCTVLTVLDFSTFFCRIHISHIGVVIPGF